MVNVVHIDEREASVVRTIFDGVVAGTSYGGITAELNEAGHQTKRRKPWTHMSVQNVIQHRDLYAGRPFERHRTVRGERLAATYSFPPIITEEQLAAVEAALKTRPKGGRPVAPLRGVVRCAKCGKVATANRVTQTQNPLSQYILSCSSRARDYRRARTGLERDHDVCRRSVSVKVVADKLLKVLEGGGYERTLQYVARHTRTLEAVYTNAQREVARLEGEREDLELRLATVAREDLVRVARALETQITKATEQLENARKEARRHEKRAMQLRTFNETATTDWKPLAEAIRAFDRPEMNRLIRELGIQVKVDFSEPNQRKRWGSIRVQLEIEMDD